LTYAAARFKWSKTEPKICPFWLMTSVWYKKKCDHVTDKQLELFHHVEVRWYLGSRVIFLNEWTLDLDPGRLGEHGRMRQSGRHHYTDRHGTQTQLSLDGNNRLSRSHQGVALLIAGTLGRSKTPMPKPTKRDLSFGMGRRRPDKEKGSGVFSFSDRKCAARWCTRVRRREATPCPRPRAWPVAKSGGRRPRRSLSSCVKYDRAKGHGERTRARGPWGYRGPWPCFLGWTREGG
jgi:hypothetical protein